jgi:TetR/AcrR family transcriptional repressor of nem operon
MARQKEFEREEVLEKALEVFWCKGYSGTSFQTLTEGMSINRQSICDTYGDKHTLFIEALHYYYKKNSAATAAHFSQQKPVKELLRSFFEKTIVDASAEQKTKGCFLQNVTLEMVPHDKEVVAVVNQNMEDLTKIFQALISRGIKSGEIVSSQTPASLAMYLVNTTQGLITLGKTVTDKKKLRAVAEVAINALG